MIRPILVYPEPILRKRGAAIPSIDDDIKSFAADLIETMNAANGIGLAAQQVGVAKQIAVVDISHDPSSFDTFRVNGEPADFRDYMPLVFLNPELEPQGKRQSQPEGCLSFPELQGSVTRQSELMAKLQLIDGRTIHLETDGLLARAIQHEVDHLNGRLFIDRMSPAAKVRIKRKVKNYRGGHWIPEPEEDQETEESHQEPQS